MTIAELAEQVRRIENGLDAALRNARKQERDEIVAWLREQVAHGPSNDEYVISLRHVITVIEAGEHLKGSEK